MKTHEPSIWLTCLALAFGPFTLRAEETAMVKEDHVNVRGQPSLAGEVVTQLRQGEKVVVLEQVDGSKARTNEPPKWARIQLPANTPVWVYAPFIDPANKTVKVSRLNLRGGPGENFSVLGRVQRGDAVKEIRRVNDWMEIEAPQGAYAFVAADLLAKPGSAPAIAAAAPPASPGPAATESKPPTTTTAAPAPATTPTAPAQPGPATSAAVTPPTTPASATTATSQALRPAASTATPPPPTPAPTHPEPVASASTPAASPPPSSTAAAAPASTSSASAPAPVSSSPAPSAPAPAPSPATAVVPAATTSIATATAAAKPSAPITRSESTATVVKLPEETYQRRIVRREGLVRSTVSIQAPTYYELLSPENRKTINYLHTDALGIDLKDYRGRRIIVTGEEAIDPRWPKTPVIEVEKLELIP